MRQAASGAAGIAGWIAVKSLLMLAIVCLRPQTFAALKAGFDAAVYKFDFPEKLRADMAWETQAIGQAMLDARGAGTYLTGPSTANQVPELLLGICPLVAAFAPIAKRRAAAA